MAVPGRSAAPPARRWRCPRRPRPVHTTHGNWDESGRRRVDPVNTLVRVRVGRQAHRHRSPRRPRPVRNGAFRGGARAPDSLRAFDGCDREERRAPAPPTVLRTAAFGPQAMTVDHPNLDVGSLRCACGARSRPIVGPSVGQPDGHSPDLCHTLGAHSSEREAGRPCSHVT